MIRPTRLLEVDHPSFTRPTLVSVEPRLIATGLALKGQSRWMFSKEKRHQAHRGTSVPGRKRR